MLPRFATNVIASRIETRVLSNVLWLVFDKCIAIVDALLVGALVARYFGPANLGVLSYATAIFAVTSTLVTFGSDNVVLRQFINEPNDRGVIFWNAALARFLLAMLCLLVIAALSASGLITHKNSDETAVLLIISVQLLTMPLLLSKTLLDAEVSAKWHVWVNNLATLASAIVRVTLVFAGASLVLFSAATVAIGMLSSISLCFIVNRLKLIPTFVRPSWVQIRKLHVECWPLVLSALSVGLYMNADIVMLQGLKGPSVAGVYSVATRLSTVWYFIPVVMGSSLLPTLAKIYSTSPSEYRAKFQSYMDINVLCAFGCILVGLVAFPPLIQYFFGAQYRDSISVFRIHIWGLPFVFLGVARSQHLTLASLHHFNMLSTFVGLCTNIALNFLLIPNYGGRGAALATIVSFALSAFVTSFFVRELRPIGWAQTRSLFFLPWRLCRGSVA